MSKLPTFSAVLLLACVGVNCKERHSKNRMEFQFQQNSHAFSTSLNFQVKKPYKIELGKVLLINVHRRRLVIQSIGCNTTLRSVWGERTAYFFEAEADQQLYLTHKTKNTCCRLSCQKYPIFLLIGVKKTLESEWWPIS